MNVVNTVTDSNRPFLLDSSSNQVVKRLDDPMLSNRAFAIFFIITILIAISLLLAPRAKAGSATWNGTNSNVWSLGTNWSAGGPPGTGDTATFSNSSATVNGRTTLDLGGGVTVNTILFDTASAAAYTIGSGAVNSQTLTLNNTAAITINSTVANNQLFNAAITLGTNRSAGTTTFTNNSTTNTLTFAGAITGSTNTGGAMGLKTLALTGAGNGTISGIISDAATGGATTAITKSGAGTWTLSGANTYTSGTAINAGILNLGSAQTGTGGPLGGSGTVASVGIISFGGGTLQFSAANQTDYSSRFSTGASQAFNIDTNGQNVTFTSALVSTGGTLTKLGTGTLTVGQNASTYTGLTTVSAGTLKVTNTTTTTPRLSGTSGITVNTGGTLLLNQGGVTVSNDRINNAANITLGAGATVGTGGIFNTGGLNEGPAGGAAGSPASMGALTLNSNSVIDFTSANSSNLLFSSLIYTAGTAVRIEHWTGTFFTDNGAATNDRLLFFSSTGLTTAQLASFQFTDDAGALLGTGATQIAFNGYFELVPVPEPSTWIGGALAFGVLGWSQRRRLRALVSGPKPA